MKAQFPAYHSRILEGEWKVEFVSLFMFVTVHGNDISLRWNAPLILTNFAKTLCITGDISCVKCNRTRDCFVHTSML